MSERAKRPSEIPFTDIMLEAIRGIKNEVLLYGIVIAALIISSAYLSLEILREVKWPLIVLSTIILIFYLFARVSKAKEEIAEDSNNRVKERVNDFRTERIRRIKAGETPMRLQEKAKIVLHVIPSNAFDQSVKFDPVSFDDSKGLLKPIYSSTHFTLDQRAYPDCFLVYQKFPEDDFIDSYVLVFRNGIIEAVDAYFLDCSNDEIISQKWIEKRLLDTLSGYLLFQKELGVELPLMIMLGYFGVCDHKIGYPLEIEKSVPQYSFQFSRDDLLLSEAVVDSFECNLAEIMKPVFDEIWSAGGLSQSKNYDELGEWIGDRQ